MSIHPSPLFAQFPSLKAQVPWVQLINRPTPVVPLGRIGAEWKHPALYVKREDLTGAPSGGSKVRNLEFILGEALSRRARKLITLAPLGSNFVNALAAQAQALRLDVEVVQFARRATPQAQAEAQELFCTDMGARLTSARGPVSAAIATAIRHVQSRLRDEAAYFITPGGSSVHGALGQVSALLELIDQVDQGQIPEPDVIVVAAGTCGTMAGLLAAIKASGRKMRVVGVRCESRLLCNRRAIARLGNRLLLRLGVSAQLGPGDFALVDPPTDAGVAKDSATQRVSELFAGVSRITLDPAYTGQAALWLERAVKSGMLAGQKVLFWHTFSPAALRWRGLSATGIGSGEFRAGASGSFDQLAALVLPATGGHDSFRLA